MIDTKTTLITTTKATVIAKNHGDYYYKSVIQLQYDISFFSQKELA